MKRKINNIIVCIAICILLLFTFIISYNVLSKNNNKSKLTTISSNDKKIKITLPSDIKFSNNKTDENYKLNIVSSDLQMLIYCSEVQNSSSKPLIDIVNLDQTDFTNKKENVKIINAPSKIELNNYEAFAYSFSYTDSKYAEDFFSEVIWIKNNDTFYILNIEIVLSNYENNKDLINSIINSFTII